MNYASEYEDIYKYDKSTSFSFELVKFISRHFFDPKIPNPGLKEIYLTRLNIMMQQQVYVRYFEQCSFA